MTPTPKTNGTRTPQPRKGPRKAADALVVDHMREARRGERARMHQRRRQIAGGPPPFPLTIETLTARTRSLSFDWLALANVTRDVAERAIAVQSARVLNAVAINRRRSANGKDMRVMHERARAIVRRTPEDAMTGLAVATEDVSDRPAFIDWVTQRAAIALHRSWWKQASNAQANAKAATRSERRHQRTSAHKPKRTARGFIDEVVLALREGTGSLALRDDFAVPPRVNRSVIKVVSAAIENADPDRDRLEDAARTLAILTLRTLGYSKAKSIGDASRKRRRRAEADTS